MIRREWSIQSRNASENIETARDTESESDSHNKDNDIDDVGDEKEYPAYKTI